MTSAAGGEQSGDTTLRAALSDPVSACGNSCDRWFLAEITSVCRTPALSHCRDGSRRLDRARPGLALLVLALALALGYVLDARAHGGARLRGDDGVGAFSD